MFGSNWRDWWFGDNSVSKKWLDFGKSKASDFGSGDWWFGDNSFWGALNVDSINYKGFGMTFGKKSQLMNYLPLVIVGLVTYKIFK
jgi:hypothetical protein